MSAPPFPRDGGGGDGGYTWMTRSALAQRLFPNLSPKDAGIRLAGIIMSTPWLLTRLRRLGYMPNRRGYTPEMVKTIIQAVGTAHNH